MPAPPIAVALAGALALAVAMGVGRFAFTPVLPMMQDDAGLSVAEGGWLASANYAGYLLGALTAASLPFGRSAAIRGGLAATGLLTLAMALTGSFALWAALRFAVGVASAWVLVSVSAFCLDHLARAGRPRLFGVVYTGVGAGVVVAGIACLLLMTQGAASGTAWLALGGLSLLALAASWFVFSERQAVAASNAKAPADWPPGSARLVICYGLYGFGYIVPATFLPVMAKEIVPDPLVFGWAWPLFGIAAGAGTIALGVLGDRVRYRNQWAGLQLLMAIGVALPALVSGLGAILAASLCIGASFVAITMVALQEAKRIAANPLPLMGALTTAFAVGQIAGPLVAGVAGAGIPATLLAASALLAISAITLRT